MSESKFSLIDLSALSKPACKLIEAVCQCVGTLYEPTRIRRKAEAEADASLVLAEADVERQALLKRAAHRLAIQEVRRQTNIERIINQAVESLPQTVSSEPVDPDWVSRFFDDCKDVTNADLQKLWARLLAKEVAKPKSCSKKTLTILKDLTSYDANLFKKFCSLIWSKGDVYFLPCPYTLNFIIEVNAQLEKYGLSYDECLHLESLGLIHSRMDFTINFSSGEALNYFNGNHMVYIQPPNMLVEICCFPLTRSGIELINSADPKFSWDFYIDWLRLFSNDYSIFLACPI